MARAGNKPHACFTRANRSSSANATRRPSRNRQAAGWTTSVAPKTPSTFIVRPRPAASTPRHRPRGAEYARSKSPSAALQRSSASRSRLARQVERSAVGAIVPQRRLVLAGTARVEKDFDGATRPRTAQMVERGAHMRERHRTRAKHADESLGRLQRSRLERPSDPATERPQDKILDNVHHRGPGRPRCERPVERLARQANRLDRIFGAEFQQFIKDDRKDMIVNVPVDRERPAIGKRLEKPLDLPSHLQPKLCAQSHARRRAQVRAPTARRSCDEIARDSSTSRSTSAG